MTFAEIQATVKRLISISGTAHDTFLKEQINFGQADFTRELNLPYADAKKSFAITAYQYIYDLPSDVDVIRGVTYKQIHKLDPVNYEQWLRMKENDSTGIPKYFIVHENKLKVYPTPNTSAPTTTLNGAVSSTTTTTITLASVGDLEHNGRGIVDNEVVDWQYVDGTNVQIKFCTRGAEGTTAATHLTAATFTLRELEYSYFKVLTDMSADADESAIPAQYHEALVLYASSRFYDKAEETSKANDLFQKYLIIKQQAAKDLGEKQAQKFTTILDDTESGIGTRDNTYPDRSSLTAA